MLGFTPRRAGPWRRLGHPKGSSCRRSKPIVEALEGRVLLTFQFAQDFDLGSNISVNQVVVNSSGDSYLAGWFEGTANFNPNGSPATITTPDSSTQAAFVAEYSPAGALSWVHDFMPRSGGSAAAVGLAVDPGNGSVYVVGEADGAVDFDPTGFDLTVATGRADAGFVVKLNASGALDSDLVRLFSLAPGADSSDAFANADAVTLDPTGQYLYVTGSYGGTYSYDGFGSLTAPNGSDSFLLKLDSGLEYIWGETAGLLGNTTLLGPHGDFVAYDQGNIVIAGSFVSIFSASDAFVEEFSGSGSVIARDEFGNDLGSTAQNTVVAQIEGMVTDPSGNVYVTGNFVGDLALGFGQDINLDDVSGSAESTPLDAFLIKFDSSLNDVWARGFGSSGSDRGLALAIDGANDLYMGGAIEGPATFGTTTGPGTVVASDGTATKDDAFILKVDSNGNLLDSTVASGQGASSVDSIAVGPSGTILAVAAVKPPVTLENLTIQEGSGVSMASVVLDVTDTIEPKPKKNPAPIPPTFQGETRVVVRVGKHHKKSTVYQLRFNGALSASEVAEPGLYKVTQIKGRGKAARPKPVGVTYVLFDPSTDSVFLTLGKFARKKPLALTASGLQGANGTTVAPFSTNL